MDLTKRQFLQGITLGAAGLIITTAANASTGLSESIEDKDLHPVFDPELEYGNMIKVFSNIDLEPFTIPWDVIEDLTKDMHRWIPNGYRQYVTFVMNRMDFGRSLGIAWYYPGK